MVSASSPIQNHYEREVLHRLFNRYYGVMLKCALSICTVKHEAEDMVIETVRNGTMRNIFLFCYYLDDVQNIDDKFVVMDKLRNLLGNRHTSANILFFGKYNAVYSWTYDSTMDEALFDQAVSLTINDASLEMWNRVLPDVPINYVEPRNVSKLLHISDGLAFVKWRLTDTEIELVYGRSAIKLLRDMHKFTNLDYPQKRDIL